MNKSGQTEIPWLWVTYLVLVGIVIAGFMSYIGTQVDDDRTKHEFYVNDITFLINRILASKFDEEYNYEIPEKFLVKITEDEVKIEFQERILSKKYVKNGNYEISYEREGDKLILRRA